MNLKTKKNHKNKNIHKTAIKVIKMIQLFTIN